VKTLDGYDFDIDNAAAGLLSPSLYQRRQGRSCQAA